MKKVMRTRICFLLAIIWMVVIFLFSSRDATRSTQDSYRVGMWMGDVFVPGFADWSQTKKLDFAKTVDHPIRKTAHATEYAVLAILIWGACAGSEAEGIRCKLRLAFPWLTATLYAATDEIHQLYVPGRSCQVTDVLIDSGGAMTGLIFVGIVGILLSKQRKPK